MSNPSTPSGSSHGVDPVPSSGQAKRPRPFSDDGSPPLSMVVPCSAILAFVLVCVVILVLEFAGSGTLILSLLGAVWLSLLIWSVWVMVRRVSGRVSIFARSYVLLTSLVMVVLAPCGSCTGLVFLMDTHGSTLWWTLLTYFCAFATFAAIGSTLLVALVPRKP